MGRDYTYNELMAMQEEATQRVREMQRRAQITAQRAQEELAQGKAGAPVQRAEPAAPPVQSAAEKSRRKEDAAVEAPPAPDWAVPMEKPEVDPARFAFLEEEPARMPASGGKTHQQKHISMPVDFIQEKREATVAAGGPAPLAAEGEKQKAGPEPGGKSPLKLLEGGSDQSLLLALMLLLSGEGTDELLLLALLYMMM